MERLEPEPFKGDAEVAKAEECLSRMEETFDLIDCNDKEKVCFATYMLQGQAYAWWSTQRRNLSFGDDVISRYHFVEAFNNAQYFPLCSLISQDI